MSKHRVDVMLFTAIMLLSFDLASRVKGPQFAHDGAVEERRGRQIDEALALAKQREFDAQAAQHLVEEESSRQRDISQQAKQREELAKAQMVAAERRASQADAARERVEVEIRKQASIAEQARGQVQLAATQATLAQQRATEAVAAKERAEMEVRRLKEQRNRAPAPRAGCCSLGPWEPIMPYSR
jgi:hypothetical protein